MYLIFRAVYAEALNTWKQSIPHIKTLWYNCEGASGQSQSYLNLKHHLDFYAALGSVAVARYGAFTRLAYEANLAL